MLELFKPERDDIIYLQHPLQFVTSMLRAMADRNVPANAETWNIILNCAIGPVAKSAVLKYMDDYKIPLYVSGQESVLADLADFMGPQKSWISSPTTSQHTDLPKLLLRQLSLDW